MITLTLVEEMTVIRKRMKWSQEDVAELMGVKVGRLRMWEQGQRPTPTESTQIMTFIKENAAKASIGME